MTANISFNPLITTNVGAAAFNVTTDGYIQGMAQDNPAARFFLSGGVLASTETLPMWGGVAVAEDIATAASPQTTPIPALGNSLVRATSVSSTIPITGFTVFDQVHSAINFPQKPGSAHSYRRDGQFLSAWLRGAYRGGLRSEPCLAARRVDQCQRELELPRSVLADIRVLVDYPRD